MKLRLILIAACTLWAGARFAQAAPPLTVAGRSALWSMHFDAERLRTGAGKELFASLDPAMIALAGEKSSAPLPKLQALAVFGFQPQKSGDDNFSLLADLGFSAEGGGISPRFEAVSHKRNVPIETIAGYPSMHFQHEGREVWIVKLSDSRVLLSTSRALLEPALAAGGLAPSTLPGPDEVLGGDVEIASLLADNPALRASELLKLLPHLDFHIFSAGEQLDLDASADLDSERSARRAARMIEGMAAAASMQDSNGVPWDERLVLKQDGPHLTVQLHLEPQEAKRLFDTFARQIENGAKAVKDRE